MQKLFLSKFVSPEIFYKCELEIFSGTNGPMVNGPIWSDTFITPGCEQVDY